MNLKLTKNLNKFNIKIKKKLILMITLQSGPRKLIAKGNMHAIFILHEIWLLELALKVNLLWS